MSRITRAAALLSIAALGFALAAGLLRPLVPPPDNVHYAARLDHLARDVAGYDVIAVGTSTLRRGFDPDRFDRDLERLGYAVRSFNMGVPGAYQYEVDHVLFEVLEQAAVKPRFVLIELPTRAIDRLVHAGNLFTDRVVAWHTRREVSAIFRGLLDWREPESRPEAYASGGRWSASRSHFRSALWRYASLGQGDRTFAHWFGMNAERYASDAELVARTRGFDPFELDREPTKLRKEFLGSVPQYEKTVEGLDQRNAGPPPYRSLELAWLRSQVDRVRAIGAEPIYVIAPTILQTSEIHWLHKRGLLPHLLAFDSPGAHPELFVPEARYDSMHLNGDGARYFTAILAEAFGGWLDERAR